MPIKNISCPEPLLKICKKINTLAHTIYYAKHSTLEESKFNNNIVNNKLTKDPIKILFSLPISAIKGFIMPVKISKNLKLMIISLFKTLLFLSLIFIVFILFKKKDYIKIEKIFYIFFLLTPLGLSIDLITSNFYTYLRYVMPINIIMISIVSFVVIEIFIKKNDQFSN